TGLVHHNDAGSQYTSVRFTERLLEEGKTELIKPRRPWRNAAQVSAETAAYVDWFNNQRLYEYCGDMPPAKLEMIHYCNWNQNGVA
ncbi:MAG: hypothetical protein ACXV3F_03755, partial [Frankiaceae bacterium]